MKIETEFRKGIFFIRLSGSLDKNTVNLLNKEIENLIKENGFKNIVFNIEKLNNIDIKGISTLFYNYEISRNNNRNLMICGLKDETVIRKMKKSRLLNYVDVIKDELVALHTINI